MDSSDAAFHRDVKVPYALKYRAVPTVYRSLVDDI